MMKKKLTPLAVKKISPKTLKLNIYDLKNVLRSILANSIISIDKQHQIH